MKLCALSTLVLASLGLCTPSVAQLDVRPDDPLGFSIREPRVRVRHSVDPDELGSSGALVALDPWLAYQRGRSIFAREWTRDDGLFAFPVRRPIFGASNSCAMCHNTPFRSAGAGGNAAEPVTRGRNTPHLFGAGLIEMLGEQIRSQMMRQLDMNGNGLVDIPAELTGSQIVIEPFPGEKLDFGSLNDLDRDGQPDLNPVVIPVYLNALRQHTLFDANGRMAGLKSPGVVGLDFIVSPFGASVSDHQFGTLRTFTNGVFRSVFGLHPDDPTVQTPSRSRWSLVSLVGARQMLIGQSQTARYRSDPCPAETVSEGELDLIELYLLNHPAPALSRQNASTQRGRELLDKFGCTSCHTPRWQIRAKNEVLGFAGDRRFFDLDVQFDPSSTRLVGSLRPLTHRSRTPAGHLAHVPNFGSFAVENIFSDLRHHDLGERFYEHGANQSVLQMFKTAPLWGVGSTAPYGHDGASLTLDDIIRRHGGEASAAAGSYEKASIVERSEVLEFLESLVLYQPDALPTDVDGDRVVRTQYWRARRDLGMERFQPELLFANPPRYRGWILGPDGDRYFSYAMINVDRAYDIQAIHRAARIHDGSDTWPKVCNVESVPFQSSGRVRWEVPLPVPRKVVWAYLTQPTLLQGWLYKPEPHSPTPYVLRIEDRASLVQFGSGRLLSLSSERRIVLDWATGGEPGASNGSRTGDIVVFELGEDNIGRSLLRINHYGQAIGSEPALAHAYELAWYRVLMKLRALIRASHA